MPVSPSFSSYRVLSKEPFIKGAKRYVIVENPKTGNTREVRFFSEAEYARTYGNKTIDTTKPIANLKEKYGFTQGPILLIRNVHLSDESKLREFAKCSYETGLGWYVESTGVLPVDAPPHLKYLALAWRDFHDPSIGEDYIRKPSQIAKIISQKIINKNWIEFNEK